ncbi:MAG: hypothetical protein ACI9OJ_001743 [Myxococcota bacterium]
MAAWTWKPSHSPSKVARLQWNGAGVGTLTRLEGCEARRSRSASSGAQLEHLYISLEILRARVLANPFPGLHLQPGVQRAHRLPSRVRASSAHLARAHLAWAR